MLLSAEARKRILKIPFARELSNLIMNVSHSIWYKKLNKTNHFDEKIRKLKSSKNGKRCFIVGNGPSLTLEQLETIKNEDCFGANRIYKMFEKTDWRPKYYVIQDRYDSTAESVYEKINVDVFFVSDIYWKEHGMKNPNAICYHTKRNLKQSNKIPFSNDVSKYIQTASTVTYTMIQLAVYMGYKKIYLIGMDHTYANITNDKGEIIKRNNVKSHVFGDENEKEVVANISYMEAAYKSAADYCEKNNVEIYNATIGGKLEVYKRINFFDIFMN